MQLDASRTPKMTCPSWSALRFLPLYISDGLKTDRLTLFFISSAFTYYSLTYPAGYARGLGFTKIIGLEHFLFVCITASSFTSARFILNILLFLVELCYFARAEVVTRFFVSVFLGYNLLFVIVACFFLHCV
jgi:hypothetical protein